MFSRQANLPCADVLEVISGTFQRQRSDFTAFETSHEVEAQGAKRNVKFSTMFGEWLVTLIIDGILGRGEALVGAGALLRLVEEGVAVRSG